MDQVIVKESRLENHINRCRCCLKKIDDDSQTVKVTLLIEKLFYDFTQIELKSSEKLSNIICINCKKDLIYFSDLKIMFTAKQLRIYEFLEDHDECVKYESNEEHFQQLLDPHLDFELSVEKYIKTEQNTETAEIPLVVDTFQWPELKNDDITEIRQNPFSKPLSKTLSNQTVVRRNTLNSKRGRQEFFCDICKIFVADSYRYKHHYDRFHLKIKNNFCDKCGFAACSKAEILSHYKYKHYPKDSKGYPCNLCDKVLSTSAYLHFHVKMIHNPKTSHCCEVCGLGFPRNINLQRHIQRIHEKKINFKCDESECNKAYYSKKELQSHYAAIHNTVPCIIKCKYCDKVFNSQLNYSRHVKSHINLQWGCDLCTEKFFKKGLLTDHKRTKHWDK